MNQTFAAGPFQDIELDRAFDEDLKYFHKTMPLTNVSCSVYPHGSVSISVELITLETASCCCND